MASQGTKRRIGWAVLIALLLIGALTLLNRRARDHAAEADHPRTEEPVARNVPPPAPPVEERPSMAPEPEVVPAEPVPEAAPPQPSKTKAPPAVKRKPPREMVKVEPRESVEPAVPVEPAPEPETRVERIEPEVAEAPPPEDGQVEIVYREDLRGLRTEQVSLTIDGQPIPFRGNTADVGREAGVTLFSGILPAGPHQLGVRVKMRGDAKVFSYLKGYTFNVDHHGQLQVTPEAGTRVTVRPVRLKGITREWTEKVGLAVDVDSRAGEADVATLHDDRG